MKKYGILAVVTLLAISGFLALNSWKGQEKTAVELYTMNLQAVEQTVVCTGAVESADSRNLYLDTPCVAGQVYFSAGQKVNKGDVLFSVDVDATKDALAAVGGSGLGGLTGEELEGVIQKEVTAPVTGVLATLNVKSGSLSDSSKPCAVISSSENLQIKVAIREKDLKNVAVGQSVQVSGTAFAKSSYPGTLTYISPSARQQYSGSVSETVVDAVVSLDPAYLDESLRMGLSAKASVVVNSRDDALIVPYDCILQDENNKEYVYIYQDGRAVRRDIVTGEGFASGCLVTSGLSKGDQLVKDPSAVKKDGEEILPKEAAA